MRRHKCQLTFPACLVLCCLAQPAAPSEIFHWVDKDGVLNFSDWAPANTALEVSKVVISESNPPDYDPVEDPNSILVQATRTNERWEDLKEQKEERREQRRELAAEPRYPAPVEYYEPYYDSSPWFYYPVRPGRPPGSVHSKPFKTAKRQVVALDRLGLSPGERPYSINSSAHYERVNAGNSIDVNSRPHRPAGPARPSHHMDW